jgi:hypothetical protein
MSGVRRFTGLLAFTGILALDAAACGPTEPDSPDPDAGGAGTGGSAAGGTGAGGSGTGGSSTAGSGAGGSGTGGSGTGGSGAGGENAGGEDAGSAGSSTAGTGAAAGGGGAGGGSTEFSEVGVCGHRGEATVTATEFSGFEEYFLIGEEGFGVDICVVRFDVTRAGDPPGECPDCEWSHAVKLENARVVLDTNGVCANSQLGFDAEMIASLEGSEPAYGYVDEYAGHVSVLMKYDEGRELWDAFGTATYEPDESTLKFERRNGFCDYRP